ncbi:MAG: hypothetical protein V5A62_00580 [Haloarculaceae archaeon]
MAGSGCPRATDCRSDLLDAVVADGPEAPVFVVSDTDERGTAWRFARGALWRVGLAAVLLAVAVPMVLRALGPVL